jgi:1,4-dihydroxy-2-naphthoate octaprenyltransferase
MRPFFAFLRLGRLQLLIGGFVFHALGTAMALYRGAAFDPGVFLWGQAAITSIQLATHFSNEYFDLTADRANPTPTRWSGGSRVLPDGKLPRWSALAAALVCSAIALVAAVTLALNRPSIPLVPCMILLALILSWSYSAPPLHLHSRGLGEFTTALLVPGLTPLLGFYLQSHHLEVFPFLAIFPLCCLQFIMLLMIEFPDEAGDRAVGKNTLVVRLGSNRAARLYNLVLALVYLCLPILLWAGLPSWIAFAVLGTLPFALLQCWRMASGAWAQPAQWNRLAFMSVFLLIAAASLELLAFSILLGLKG